MARRRRWSTGARVAYGLGQGANDVFAQMMRDLSQQRNAAQISAREEARDRRTLERQGQLQQQSQQFTARQDAFKQLPELVDKLGPEGALNYVAAQGVELFPTEHGPDFVGTGEYEREKGQSDALTQSFVNSMRPPLRRKLDATVGTGIAQATSPEQLTTAQLVGQVRAADPRSAGLSDEMLVDPTDPEQQAMALSVPGQEMVARGRDKADALRNKPTQIVSGTRDSGAGFTQAFSPYDMTQGIQTSPDATQQGVNKLAETRAQFDPAFEELKTRTSAKMTNIAEALTRQAKIDTAAGIAGAQKRAELAPDIVQGEVDRQQRLQSSSQQSTESERRAAANWTPLVNAHANALVQETNGAVLTPGAVEITGSSWLNPVFGGFVDPGTKDYAQAARDFVTTLGYIRSGVQVRADEVDKFLATMFAFEGDGPQQIQQKQQSREILLGAMQAMVGRSAPEAARVLAAAINNRQIPMGILTSVEIRPEIAKHLLPLLSGVPKFDLNGNLIGVQPQ